MEFAAGTNRALSTSDYRRQSRMISNRESARRSRMRKQRHLEGLRRRVGRLRLENYALSDRIAAVSGSCIVLRHENELLRSESGELQRRLFDIRHSLFLRQLHRLSSPLSPPLLAISSSPESTAAGKEQIMASLS